MAIPRGQNFATCYVELCKQQRIRPLPVICVALPNSLDITTDRVKMDDWGPILNSLSLDRSLKSVVVRSRWYLQWQKSLGNFNTDKKKRIAGKTSPVVLTHCLLEWLSHSIAQCIKNSPNLTYLEIEGVPLPTECLAALCVGIANTQTLQHLSLQRCYIGDNSCALICQTIAKVPCIKSLNLSQCGLSSDCGLALASALCRQKLLLYHDTWKDSLRYRDPNPEAMPGLRRLTLNENPHLGDSAIAQIIDAVQDSLWIKALDLQNCGLTNAIGNKILELLDLNKTLEVVDVRSNFNLGNDIVRDVFERLESNNRGCNSKYRLLNLKDQKRASKSSKAIENNKNKILRSKSMIVPNSNGPYRLNDLNRNSRASCPALINDKRRKSTIYPSPKSKNKDAEKNPRNISLYLDLQSQIRSVDGTWKNKDKVRMKDAVNHNLKKGIQTRNVRKVNDTKVTHKFEDLLKQLSDVKMEKNNLLRNTQTIKGKLEEERARRQTIETKLRTMKKNLADLENALKAKELETRGFFRASQQSFDEISASFNKLLQILNDCANDFNILSCRRSMKERLELEAEQSFSSFEDEAKGETEKDTNEVEKPSREKKSVVGLKEDEREAKQIDIKRKVDLFIRKTKSEKLYRDFLQIAKLSKKLSKSENDVRLCDIRSFLGSINLMKVGDYLDSVDEYSLKQNNSVEKKAKPSPYTPSERACAAFTEIINLSGV